MRCPAGARAEVKDHLPNQTNTRSNAGVFVFASNVRAAPDPRLHFDALA